MAAWRKVGSTGWQAKTARGTIGVTFSYASGGYYGSTPKEDGPIFPTRKEAQAWAEHAIGLRANPGPPVRPLLRHDIRPVLGWSGYAALGRRIYRSPDGRASVQEKPDGFALFALGKLYGKYRTASAAIKAYEAGMFVEGSGGAMRNPAKGAPRRRNHWLLPMAVGAGAMHLAHRAKLMNPRDAFRGWLRAVAKHGRFSMKTLEKPALLAELRAIYAGNGSIERGIVAATTFQMKTRQRSKANPARSRWGYTFKKGDVVQDHRGVTYRYVKLAKADDFSRAYGRQAIVSVGIGPIDPDETMEVGLNDLRPVAKQNPAGSRVTLDSIARGAPFNYGKRRGLRTYVVHFSDGSTSEVGPGVIGNHASDAEVRHYFRNILAEKNR